MSKKFSDVISKSRTGLSETLTRSKIRYLSRKLEMSKLIEEEENETFDINSPRLLGHYTTKGLDYIFKMYGLYQHLKTLGLERVEIILEKCPDTEGRMFVYSSNPKIEEPLIELVLRSDSFNDSIRPDLKGKRMLRIEWLLMQNPLDKSHELLPGQKYPGLKSGKVFFELIQVLKWRLKFDNIIAVPRFFNNAVQYSAVMEFIDPEAQKYYDRILYEFSHLSFVEVSKRIDEGKLFFNNGEKVVWNTPLLIDRKIMG